MINLPSDTKEGYSGTDAAMVETLVQAATAALEKASLPDITTPSEILSAAFTILNRVLRALRNLQAPEDRATNAKEIARVLQEFLVEFGQVPS